jgi:3-oxoadipate enol-lactonase
MKKPHLHTVQEGSGPVVVLSHALGCELGMWDGVAAALKGRYTVLRHDHRGHGRSEAVPGPYSIDMLADDVAGLIEAHGAGPVHFVGLSMRGMTAQALAAKYPQRVRSITVANAAMYYDEAARAMWAARVKTVLAQGMEAIADGALQRWFTPEFRADEAGGGAQRVAVLRERLVKTDAAAYAASCEAVAGIDFRASNGSVQCPTLVIAGTRDEATPVALSEAICKSIQGAQMSTLPAAHLSAVEQPGAFADLLTRFFESQSR